ncbi:hypothetical protein KC19_VG157600 [Ceratodon purpureus]|uniref:Uncharacterized protein n=1 Tax=Ceratodon purpureus TaxID=3225 RepID=A0A8T0HRL3_CERPU|nr:hypothetical protein KC19_VG157600 [Ceratodon purpureus]
MENILHLIAGVQHRGTRSTAHDLGVPHVRGTLGVSRHHGHKTARGSLKRISRLTKIIHRHVSCQAVVLLNALRERKCPTTAAILHWNRSAAASALTKMGLFRTILGNI